MQECGLSFARVQFFMKHQKSVTLHLKKNAGSKHYVGQANIHGLDLVHWPPIIIFAIKI